MGTREGRTTDTMTHSDGFLYCWSFSHLILSKQQNGDKQDAREKDQNHSQHKSVPWLGWQTAKSTHLCCKGTFGMHCGCSGFGNAVAGVSAQPLGCHCHQEHLSFSCLAPSHPHRLLFPQPWVVLGHIQLQTVLLSQRTLREDGEAVEAWGGRRCH